MNRYSLPLFTFSLAVCDPEPMEPAPEAEGPLGQRVFVSSETFTAKLGGWNGASEKCTMVAEDADLDGKWVAILSDDAGAARDRVEFSGGLFNMNDELVTGDDLWGGALMNAIRYDENGKDLGAEPVWTGTDENGYATQHCVDWTDSLLGTGSIGRSDADDSEWIFVPDMIKGCQRQYRLYCVSKKPL